MNQAGTFWPTSSQRQLLQAALLPGEEACTAWKYWSNENEFESIDAGSYRLLPLVYDNLIRQDYQDKLIPRLKGIFRLSWSKNQLLFRRAADALRLLNADRMLLKGAALSLAYYSGPGVRAMDDIDVLVHPEEALPLLQNLLDDGWQSIHYPKDSLADIVERRHSVGMAHQNGGQIDIHWDLFKYEHSATAISSLWEHAGEVLVNDLPTKIPDATDLLLHTCRHGVRYNKIPSIRWIADAHTILQNPDYPIDWERFLQQARSWQVNLALSQALTYLHRSFDVPIPDAVITQLGAMPTSIHQRILYNSDLQPIPNRWWRLYRFVPWSWWRYFDTGKGNLLQKLVGFPGYLQKRWGLHHLWQLPAAAFRYSSQKIRSLLS